MSPPRPQFFVQRTDRPPSEEPQAVTQAKTKLVVVASHRCVAEQAFPASSSGSVRPSYQRSTTQTNCHRCRWPISGTYFPNAPNAPLLPPTLTSTSVRISGVTTYNFPVWSLDGTASLPCGWNKIGPFGDWVPTDCRAASIDHTATAEVIFGRNKPRRGTTSEDTRPSMSKPAPAGSVTDELQSSRTGVVAQYTPESLLWQLMRNPPVVDTPTECIWRGEGFNIAIRTPEYSEISAMLQLAETAPAVRYGRASEVNVFSQSFTSAKPDTTTLPAKTTQAVSLTMLPGGQAKSIAIPAAGALVTSASAVLLDCTQSLGPGPQHAQSSAQAMVENSNNVSSSVSQATQPQKDAFSFVQIPLHTTQVYNLPGLQSVLFIPPPVTFPPSRFTTPYERPGEIFSQEQRRRAQKQERNRIAAVSKNFWGAALKG